MSCLASNNELVIKSGIEFIDNVIIGPRSYYEPDAKGLGPLLFDALQRNPNQLSQGWPNCGSRATCGSLKDYLWLSININAATDETDTNHTFLQRSIRIAQFLKAKGITKGDVITICSENNIHTAAVLVAVQFVGAITANLDPILPVKDAEYLLSLVPTKMIFASSTKCSQDLRKLFASKQGLLETVYFDSDLFKDCVINDISKSAVAPSSDIVDEATTFQPEIISDINSTTCCICFSSGSTGLPKAVCLSQSAVMRRMHYITHSVHSEADLVENLMNRMHEPHIVIHSSSLYWISGVVITFAHIANGTCRLLWSFDSNQFWDILDKYRPIWVMLLPVQAIAACKSRLERIKQGEYNVQKRHHLTMCAIGGAPISLTQLLTVRENLPGTYVFQLYGMTEASGAVAKFNVCNAHQKTMLEVKPMSCGMPHQDFTYKIVDPDSGATLGPNQRGELWLRSPCLLSGYLGMKPENVFEDGGWLKTGDIVYYDEDFCFFVVDRIKEMLKYDGWVISPAIVEMVLLRHSAVKEAAVIGGHCNDLGDLLTAVVVPESEWNGKVTAEELVKFVDEQVHDKQKLRGGVHFVGKLPVTPTGKVKRKQLKEMILNATLNHL